MKTNILSLIAIISGLASCQKFVDPGQPSTQLASATVFSSDATATSAMLSIYPQLESSSAIGDLATHTGLSSDEFALNSTAPAFVELHTNNLAPGNTFSDGYWAKYYQFIYQANAVMEGLDKSTGVTEPVKRQLKGEALFIRAFSLFHLINIYGDAPLAVVTDYETNRLLKRTAVADVYKQINTDLRLATTLLTDEYRTPANAVGTERTRANKAAAFALLAKALLYQGDWVNASAAADSVILKTSLYELLPNPSNVFLKASREQVWQVQSVLPGLNTYAGYQLILTGTPSNVHLDKRVVDLFDPSDKRRAAWVGVWKTGNDSFFYAYKYKAGVNAPITEYTSMLRLAEVILIRAEALAMQDKTTAAEFELNKVRARAGISTVSGLSKSDLIVAIAVERQRELFAENGNRWFDLKRTGEADRVLGQIKGSNWKTTDALYPVPINELRRSSVLEQNPGY